MGSSRERNDDVEEKVGREEERARMISFMTEKVKKVGPEEFKKQFLKCRARDKVVKIKEHLKTVGMRRSITTNTLFSKCDGERVLTLRQKETRSLLSLAEVNIREACSNGDKQKEEHWTLYADRTKRVIHQVNLAMKVLSSPLHHTEDDGGYLAGELEVMSDLESDMIEVATAKMPPLLGDLLKTKLNDKFGPSFDFFVQALIINITMQLFMPWHEYLEMNHCKHLDYISAYFPTEEELVADLRLKFCFEEDLEDHFCAEQVVEAVVKKMELAFANAATPEDKVTVEMHKLSLAQAEDA